MKIKNTVIILEASINDEILQQVKNMKDDSEDKRAVIEECAALIRENHPDVEIFDVGPNYIVTETSMYLAFFEDEIEME